MLTVTIRSLCLYVYLLLISVRAFLIKKCIYKCVELFFNSFARNMLPQLVLPFSTKCRVRVRYRNRAGCYEIYKLSPRKALVCLDNFKTIVNQPLFSLLRQLYATPCKIQFAIKCLFLKTDDEGNVTYKYAIRRSKQYRIFNERMQNIVLRTLLTFLRSSLTSGPNMAAGGSWRILST